MGFEPIRRIMPQVIASHQIAKPLEVRHVLEIAVDVLAKIWGAERAAYLNPVSFREGTLRIEARSPAAKQQLQMDGVRIMNEINRTAGKRLVLKIDTVARGF